MTKNEAPKIKISFETSEGIMSLVQQVAKDSNREINKVQEDAFVIGVGVLIDRLCLEKFLEQFREKQYD